MARTVRLATVAIVIAALAALALATAALVAFQGWYNVAATKQHTGLVYKLLDFAMYESVKAHAPEIVPPPLGDPQRVLAGAVHYRAHCLPCHGAPGVAPHPFAYGMQPAPVNLVPAARHWKPQQVYWVVKHGLKMSGMPAWEYRLTEEEIWDVVAFVMAMRHLSPVEYAAMAQKMPAHVDERPREPDAHLAPPRSALPAPALRSPWLGDVSAGRKAMHQYLCTTCHQIPGVVGATRHVGPPLNGMGSRRYIAGILPNTPENMVRWLMHPQRFAPRSAMPDLHVTAQDARDMAAYLYTLQDTK